MSCSDMALRLQAYIDGELDAVNALEVERHLGACPACAARVRFAKALGATLREQARSMPAPDALRERIRRAVEAQGAAPAESAAPTADIHPASGPSPVRIPFRQPRYPLRQAGWFLGGALAASLAAFLVIPGLPGRPGIESELLSDHLRSLLEKHLTDVPSSDQHTVKPWFAGRLDVAPPAPDLTLQGFRLLGGRLDYVGDRKVGVLIYQRRQHIINVFVWAAGGSHGPATASRKGYNFRHWQSGGLVFWAVSDLNAGELADFEKAFRDASA